MTEILTTDPCDDVVCHPKPYANILFVTSWIYFIASSYGFYKKKYDLATYTGLVWVTSVNYWNNPSSRFNYYLDITTVRTGILYHLIRAMDSPNYMTFYKIFNTGLLCYIPSRYYYSIKKYIASTISHAGLHLITGAGLIYLYSKPVRPLLQSYFIEQLRFHTNRFK